MTTVTGQPRLSSAGSYILGERIAVGGMGEVRVAFKTGAGQFQKPVAIKLLLPHLAADPAAVRMFLEEARLAGRMSHPNIVQILDAGVDGDSHYLAMELVRGVSLGNLVRELGRLQRPLPLDIVQFIGRSLCSALHYAHAHEDVRGQPLRIVHRDVNPQNILISTDGQVKLADFGIAKALTSSEKTRTGLVRGTLQYMSPEQVAGGSIDHRADLYGAALCLFEMLVGSVPFKRSTEEETYRAIRLDPLPSIRQLRPEVPQELAMAVERGAHKDPAQRFRDALELREAIGDGGDREGAERLAALVVDCCAADLRALETKTSLSLETLQGAHLGQTATLPGAHSARAVRWRPLLIAAPLALIGGVALFLDPLALSRRNIATPAVAEARPVESTFQATLTTPATAPAAPAVVDALPASTLPPPATADTEPRASRRSGTAAVGRLNVGATPWANVTVDGKPIGDTPIAGYPVESGLVTVVLTNPESGKRVQRRLRIAPGKAHYIKADLR